MARQQSNTETSLTRKQARTKQDKNAQNVRTTKTAPPGTSPDEKSAEPSVGPDGADEGLKQLALKRAERVKEYLLQVGKVESERVFIADESEGKVTTKGSRAYIHLR